MAKLRRAWVSGMLQMVMSSVKASGADNNSYRLLHMGVIKAPLYNVEDGPWVGRTSSQYRGGTHREVLWHSGVGVSVAGPCMPSGDSPR